MSWIRKATVDGLNEYLAPLRKDGHKYNVSLTLFDTVVTQPVKAKPLTELPDFGLEDYDPMGGTALYDGVCSTLKGLKGGKKNLVLIWTDGGENSSREYKKADMKAVIEELQATNKWTFVFMGANQDAYAEAAQYGIPQANAVTFNATPAGMGAVMRTASLATSGYSGQSAGGSSAFYSAKQQKEVEDVK